MIANRHARLVRGVCLWGLGVGLIGIVIERVLSVGWNYDVYLIEDDLKQSAELVAWVLYQAANEP